MEQKPALLMLDDGTCFEGKACGACAEAEGEVIFTTGMAGYQETITDPSYYGQIVVFTAAHIGNYGSTPLDDEAARPVAAGAVFHDLFTSPASASVPHWRADNSFDHRLAKAGLTSIKDVDTRALTLHLREHGARPGIISALDLDKPSLLRRAQALPSMQGQDLAAKATCKQMYSYTPDKRPTPGLLFGQPGTAPGNLMHAEHQLRVAVVDFGVKRSILACLTRLNMVVTVFPAITSAKDILASNPDGVLLSNGPGDPEPCSYAVDAIRELLGRVPLFGICLGHQLLGRVLGGKTYKLPFGHHGVNHPVKDLDTGRVHITSQNHGFCVDPDSLPGNARVSHWNLNDDTLEGLVVTDVPAFSVQFHPEAAPGPTDAQGLFIRFRDLILQGGAHA